MLRHHRPALETLVGDGLPADPGRPERIHERPVDTWQQVDGVAHMAEGLEVVVVQNGAAGGDDYRKRVTLALQVILVRQVVVDERAFDRNRAQVAGIQLQVPGGKAEEESDRKAERQDDPAVAE